MNSKLLKELDKLKYLNTYNRGKTLTENRILLTEDLTTLIFSRIFKRKLGTELIQAGITNAEKMNIKNLNTFVKEEFSEILNKQIKNAQKNAGLPAFGPSLGKVGGKTYDVDMMLSLLQRIMRDGSSKALSTLERNVVHDALALVDDDFFKLLQKQLNLNSEFTALTSKKTTNALKKDILNNSTSLKGLSDELFEKLGVPISVIRKTIPDVIDDWWTRVIKGTKEALAIIGPKLKAVLKNAKNRFKNLTKRIKWGGAKKFIVLGADLMVSATLIPIWLKMTFFKALALRFTAGALGRALKSLLPKAGKEAVEKFSKTDKFWKGGLFSDLITVVGKEGVEATGKKGFKIVNLPSFLSKLVGGSRSFNYGLAGLIWIGYILADTPLGKILTKGKNYILGMMDGEVLGACSYAALSPLIANQFAPEDDPGALNKLGITYDMKEIKGDAYELYTALSPQCFVDEEDFATADEVIKEFLENAPSRLYTSLVAREYHKLTGKPEGQVLPEWKDMCREGFFVKGQLHDDIIAFEKHKDYWADFFTWNVEMVRLPLREYTNKLCAKPFIEQDFDQLLRDANDYLWTPGADVPDFIQEVVDGMSIEQLESMAEGFMNNAQMWETIQEKFDEEIDKLELKGITFNSATGEIMVDMKEMIKLQVKLNYSAGIDQLVYLSPEGYFLDRPQLYGGEREEWLDVDPQKMVVKINPSIENDISYAIGSVQQYIEGAVNTNALNKDELCSSDLAETGYLCYLAQFRDGENYRDWLPDTIMTDNNGVKMSLKDRVPSDRQHEIGEQNQILWEIAAYIKFNTIAKDERYRDYLPYKVYPEFVDVGRIEEGYIKKLRNKIGLGILLDR